MIRFVVCVDVPEEDDNLEEAYGRLYETMANSLPKDWDWESTDESYFSDGTEIPSIVLQEARMSFYSKEYERAQAQNKREEEEQIMYQILKYDPLIGWVDDFYGSEYARYSHKDHSVLRAMSELWPGVRWAFAPVTEDGYDLSQLEVYEEEEEEEGE